MIVRAAALRDLYLDGAEAAVMVNDFVASLSALATATLLAIPPQGIALDELTHEMVERFGDPGDAAQRVRAVVSELTALGAVRAATP